ncbi:HAAS signaling domain-containing protein [Olivibacter sitiensis]|uniref:HAAS signaling domain-containing protein n=1 Tax=Olivibacter sitiensis TaxID=376470 RepID=UPI00041CAAF2|nr:DUF1700 domain-containing protein [Olivibacter sitiensis]
MKIPTFQQDATVKLYQHYINRVKRTVKTLPWRDRDDVLMEINSHIHEGMQKANETQSETEALQLILDKLGKPEVVFKPLVAERKLKQATITFNPLHVMKALALNISNGFIYLVFSLLYLLQLTFIFMVGAKLVYPDQVGLFFKNGNFHLLGIAAFDVRERQGLEEVLGNWFIPVMLVATVLSYLLTTLLLRLKRKK